MARRSRLGAFRALAGNRALRRVVAGYALFILTEYSVWIAMLVYAYSRGGATIAGVVALAQLVPAALLAPVFAALADRRSPVVLLAGGYLAEAAGMGATAVAIAGACRWRHTRRGGGFHCGHRHPPGPVDADPVAGGHPDQLTQPTWGRAGGGCGTAVAGSLTGALTWLTGVAGVLARAQPWRASRRCWRSGWRVPRWPPAGARSPTAAGGSASVRLAVRQPRRRRCWALLTPRRLWSGRCTCCSPSFP